MINLQCLLVTYNIENRAKALHWILCYFDGELDKLERKGCTIRTHMKNGLRASFFFFLLIVMELTSSSLIFKNSFISQQDNNFMSNKSISPAHS